ncbi:MAG: phosphoribosyltransferase, partial [Planctomycetota bacterium]
MATPKEVFLQRFDEGVRPEIVEFGKRIRRISNESDVIVFMARKAACFAEALRVLKLTSYHCEVASHRVVDMNISWMAGKRVAVIDDALITGTTMFRTAERLRSVASEVSCHVFCVNRHWWARDLVQPKAPYLELDDEQCACLCARIVEAISLVPIPYSTDYPLFGGFYLHARHIEKLLARGDWSVSEVGTNLQKRNGVFSKTFTPTDE